MYKRCFKPDTSLWLLTAICGMGFDQLLLNLNMPYNSSTPSAPMSPDEAAIRALQDRFAAAVNAADPDAVMENYIPDNSLVVFDVVPRKDYFGADAYRKAWEDFFQRFKGGVKLTIIDLHVSVDGNLAFGHSFMNTKGADGQGHSVDRTVRVTAGYRKINGNWLIVHEHISMPVDLTTGKVVPVTVP